MFSPCDIIKKAQERNVTIDYMPFETIRGCILKAGDNHHVGIAENLPEVSARQTIAHELAHLEDDTIDSVWAFHSEGRAYKRAREILVPCEALRDLLTDGFTDYTTLASLFGVSPKMIQLRCQDLSIF